MEQRINPFTRIFAIIFVILFVITGIIAILVFNSFNMAFNPSVYKNALSDSGIYENLPKLIGEQIVYQVDHNPCIQDATTCMEDQKSTIPGYFKSIDATEWKAVLSKLIDPVWFQTQVESAIDQVFSFLKSPGRPLSLNISLTEFKARLGGEDGYQAMMLLIHSLEPCTAKDLLKLPMSFISPSGFDAAELCLPSEPVLKLGDTAIRTMLKDLAVALPDNTSTLFEAVSSRLSTNLESSLRTLQMIRLIAMISPIIPLFLLLIVTLLVVRNLRGFLTWWGIPLTIIGILVFASALSITPAIRALLLSRFNAQGLVPSMVELIKTLLLNITRSFEYALLVQAGILCVAGIVMIVLSAVLRSKPTTMPGE
ncbi:MAG: hypothetical protein WBV22_00970 [Anaerolineaceae bacterium]